MKELIISTFLLLTSLSTFAADEFADQKAECNKNKAKIWSATKSRCILKTDFRDSLKNYRSCTDKETKAQRDECLLGLVTEVTGDTSFDDFDDTTVMILNSLTAIVSSLNWFMIKKGTSACTSLKMSAICGGASIAADFYLRSKGEEATEGIKSDFLEKAKDQNNYETQVIAYQAQIDQMKSISDFYDMKANGHMISGACYLATVVVALSEATYGNMQCLLEEPEAEADSDKKGVADKAKKPDIDPDAYSKFAEANGGWAQWTATPYMIAAINTINFGWHMYLNGLSKEEADKADFLSKRLDIAKNQFVDGMASYCPKGHEDKSNPMCYCYENGKKKSNRTNSQTCKSLWDARDRQLYVDSKDKERGAIAKTRVGCVNINGKFDPKCECRKFKDQQGNNACRRASFTTVGLGGFGNHVNVKDLEEKLSLVSQGVGTPEGLITDKDVLTAVGDKLKKQVISKLKTKDKDGNDKPMGLKDFDKLKESILKNNSAAANALAKKQGYDKSLKQMTKEAIDSINKKSPLAVKSKGLVMQGGKGIGLKKKKKKEDLSFNLSNGGGSTVQSFKQDYMDKTYNTKDADINSRKDVSIFKILSNRYNKSGYKRLFDD
jgi:hypothetical protein